MLHQVRRQALCGALAFDADSRELDLADAWVIMCNDAVVTLNYYTGIFQGKVKNFPAVQPRFFCALQCSTIAFRECRTEA